jgi:seryl-tRNA synthetase
MRIFELATPKSPEQLRLDQLKASSKRASNALKIERERQKLQRAEKALQQLRKPKSNKIKPIQPIKPI